MQTSEISMDSYREVRCLYPGPGNNMTPKPARMEQCYRQPYLGREWLERLRQCQTPSASPKKGKFKIIQSEHRIEKSKFSSKSLLAALFVGLERRMHT